MWDTAALPPVSSFDSDIIVIEIGRGRYLRMVCRFWKEKKEKCDGVTEEGGPCREDITKKSTAIRQGSVRGRHLQSVGS